jgi:hypothetical protein
VAIVDGGRVSLEGDFSKLEALGRKLNAAARDEFAKSLKQPLESTAQDLYHKSFAEQQGPVGGAWPESPNAMFLTGALANPEIEFDGKQLVVSSSPYYARFHQGGWQTGGERVKIAVSTNIKTRKVKKKTARIGGKAAGPARPILPTSNTAGTWDSPLRETIDSNVRRHFGTQ